MYMHNFVSLNLKVLITGNYPCATIGGDTSVYDKNLHLSGKELRLYIMKKDCAVQLICTGKDRRADYVKW